MEYLLVNDVPPCLLSCIRVCSRLCLCVCAWKEKDVRAESVQVTPNGWSDLHVLESSSILFCSSPTPFAQLVN